MPLNLYFTDYDVLSAQTITMPSSISFRKRNASTARSVNGRSFVEYSGKGPLRHLANCAMTQARLTLLVQPIGIQDES